METAAHPMTQLFWCAERQAYVNLYGEVEQFPDHGPLAEDGHLYAVEEQYANQNVGQNNGVVHQFCGQSNAQSFRYDPYQELERSTSSGDNTSHVGVATSNSDGGLSDCGASMMDTSAPSLPPQGHAQQQPPVSVQPLGYNAARTPSFSSHGSCLPTPTATHASTSPSTSPSQADCLQFAPQNEWAPQQQEQGPLHYDASTAPPPLLPSRLQTFEMFMHHQPGTSPSHSEHTSTPPQSLATSPHRVPLHQVHQHFSHEQQYQPMVMASAQQVECQAPQVPLPQHANHCDMPPQGPPSRFASEIADQAPIVYQQQSMQQHMQEPMCEPMMQQAPQEPMCEPMMQQAPQEPLRRDVKVLVEFKHGRRAVCICDSDVVDLDQLPCPDFNLVEGDRGHDICRVICLSSPRVQSDKAKSTPPPRVMRPATPEEVSYWQEQLGEEEQSARALVNKLIAQAKLPLTVTHASYQIDRKKLTFYYESSEHQPDFRCLLSECYAFWKCRIWFTNLPRRHSNNKRENRRSRA